MSQFVNTAYRDAAIEAANRLFPLLRAEGLQEDFTRVFSTHLGHLIGGGYFEADGILVTGQSGSGKTTEIRSMIKRFNADAVELPNGTTARIAECSLKGVATWKDLGKSSSEAVGFPMSPKASLNQSQIWDIVIREAKIHGYVGIHFDEVQHIFREKSRKECLALLDSFKSLMKNHDWPLMLIFSGMPELDGYLRMETQVYGRLESVRFEDIEVSDDPEKDDRKTVHEIVGSYGLLAGLEVDQTLMTHDFLNRLIVAGAYRWGLVIKLTKMATAAARDTGETHLTRDHFVKVWVNKTKVTEMATPFLHSGFETMYRREHPFVAAIAD